MATEGASSVLINGRKTHRLGDLTQHCGGAGRLIEGSPDVIIGDECWSQDVTLLETCLTWIEIELQKEDGSPAANERYWMEFPDGSIREGVLDSNGVARIEGVNPGECKISFVEVNPNKWNYKGG
jgi:hypothetical protein